MYAVIENGGKQYRVELGTELTIDRMDVEAGQTVHFDHVLLVADGDEATIGRPHVAGARVSADVLRQSRGDKIVVFKYRPKARSRVKQGARADLTVLRIADIVHGSHSAAKVAEAARTERQRLEAAAAEAAATQAAADKVLADKLARASAAAEAKAAAVKAAQTPVKGTAKGATSKAAAAKSPPAKGAATTAKRATTKAVAPKVTGAAAKDATAPAKPNAKTPRTASTRTQAPQPPTKPAPRKKKDE